MAYNIICFIRKTATNNPDQYFSGRIFRGCKKNEYIFFMCYWKKIKMLRFRVIDPGSKVTSK